MIITNGRIAGDTHEWAAGPSHTMPQLPVLEDVARDGLSESGPRALKATHELDQGEVA